MKIYEGQRPILKPAEGKTDNAKGTEESEFRKIMDQALQGQENKKGPAPMGVPPSGGVLMVQGLDKIQGSLPPVGREQVMSTIDQTLDLVEFYAKKLADTSISTEGIRPLLSHLDDRATALRDMGSDPALPERLRPVISDLVLTISTEVEKFKRGDYS